MGLQPVDQVIDDGGGIAFGNLAEVGITRGGGGTGMAEQSLDMAQAQALFEQVGGVAVAQ